jgi:hypothetical protein
MANWHPILNTRESTPGTWDLHGPVDEVYATITLVRRGDELGYRITVNPDDAPPFVLGYHRTLMSACRAAHTWFTSTRGPHGIPHAGYAGAEWGK